MAQQLNYKLCKFNTSNGDIKKQWFVYFYTYNKSTNQYKRHKEYISTKLNALQRHKAMKDIKKSIDALLIKDKFNPFNKNYQKQGLTIKQAFEMVIEHNKNHYPFRTANVFNNTLLLLIDEIGYKPINQIDSIFLEDSLLNMQEKRGFAARRYNQMKSHLTQALKHLRRKRIIESIYTRDIDNQKITQTETTVWTDKEIKTWFDYMHQNQHRLLVISYLVYHCFVRIEECLRIQLKHIDLAEQLLYIPPANSKNNKGQYITISQALKEIIAPLLLKKDEENFLVGKNYEVSPDAILAQAIYALASRTRKKIQLPDHCTLYRLKHTGNTLLLNNGVDIKQLQEQNRHSSQKQTETYAQKLKGKANPIFKNLPKV